MNNIVDKIPKYLFRGDSDDLGIRKLRTTIEHGQFQTNLISGGEGRIIFETPLIELINIHVGIGWKKTHFLSFTEEIVTAYKFGLRDPLINEQYIKENYVDGSSASSAWLFALLTLETERINWGEVAYGVFEGFYKPNLKKFTHYLDDYRIILLDVVRILTEYKDLSASYTSSLENAVLDKEWLLLPATITRLNSGQLEYSAILDGGCISYKTIAKN
jgi:hypothetical protein